MRWWAAILLLVDDGAAGEAFRDLLVEPERARGVARASSSRVELRLRRRAARAARGGRAFLRFFERGDERVALRVRRLLFFFGLWPAFVAAAKVGASISR